MKKSNRTSILFQAGLSAATSKRDVIFICTDEFQDIPLFVHNMPGPGQETLNLIKFK